MVVAISSSQISLCVFYLLLKLTGSIVVPLLGELMLNARNARNLIVSSDMCVTMAITVFLPCCLARLRGPHFFSVLICLYM